MPLGNSPQIDKKLLLDNWPIRRRWMRIGVIALWVNAEIVLYYILAGEPDGFKVQVFMTLVGAILSIFAYYVFGATWDDRNKFRFIGDARRDDDDETPEDGVPGKIPAREE